MNLIKHAAFAASFQGETDCTSHASARKFSTSGSSPLLDSTEGNGFKGHSMLAPFTAEWHSTDLEPLIIERSEGSYVYDSKGNKYLDTLAGLWCTALGGSEPRLVKAATDQLNKLPFYHSFWNSTAKPPLDLAEELISMFTAKEMGKVFFTNSGSEANDSQVKLVWYYNNALGRPNKKKIIAQSQAYHGSTLISASLSGLPAMHLKFDLPAPFVLHTDCPHYWRFGLPGEAEEEFATRLADNLENLILKEGPETVAAFIAEPVIGAGGVIPPPKTYFEKTRGVGLLLATEFANNKSPNDPFPVEWGVAQIFGAECKKRGMLVKVVGDEIAMSPPLIMSQREVDGLVSIYGEALKATEERVAELRSKKK